MLIREAVEKDVSDILGLLSGMDGDGGLSLLNATEIWNKIKEYPYYKVLVVEDKDRIIGTCSLIVIDNLGHNGSGLAVVESVIIEQNYRGKGVGTLMMNHVAELARNRNCYKLMLSSNKKRVMAHRFYQKLGFKQHGISFAIEVNQND